MHKVLATGEPQPAVSALGGWNDAALDELRRGFGQFTGKKVDRVIVAPPGYFTVDQKSSPDAPEPPEPRVAAYFTIPAVLQPDRGEEGVVVVSSVSFKLPRVDSLIWGIRDHVELEQFWDNAPFVRDTQSLIVFMLHPHLGISVSHSGTGHVHTLLALRFAHQQLFPDAALPPEDYPHLARGRILPHITRAHTITFSTERDPSVDPKYQTFLDRIMLAVRALRDLGLSEDSLVKFQAEDKSQRQVTIRELLAESPSQP